MVLAGVDMEMMNSRQIGVLERRNTGTSWTLDDTFEKNGYFIIRNLWNPEDLYCDLPYETGQLTYWGSGETEYSRVEVEPQVEGSLSRYWHPKFKKAHYGIRDILEQKIGRKLYNTYYYDRFYFPGQELKKHVDRDACEISVTVNISSNIEEPWPIWIKTPDTYFNDKKLDIILDGKKESVILKPGDGMVYKGVERPHWREPLKAGRVKNRERQYYHQIFFHYVLQDGQRAHCAWDRAR